MKPVLSTLTLTDSLTAIQKTTKRFQKLGIVKAPHVSIAIAPTSEHTSPSCYKGTNETAIAKGLNAIQVPYRGDLTKISVRLGKGEPKFALAALRYLALLEQTDEVKTLIKRVCLAHPTKVSELVTSLVNVAHIRSGVYSVVEGTTLASILLSAPAEIREAMNTSITASIFYVEEHPSAEIYNSTIAGLCEWLVIHNLVNLDLLEAIIFMNVLEESLYVDKAQQLYDESQLLVIEQVSKELS